MEINSLQVCVPASCRNDCPYCCAKMHGRDNVTQKLPNMTEYARRLAFARDLGAHTAVLTGTGEPILNRTFLEFWNTANAGMAHPFTRVELQTSGTGLDLETLRFLRDYIGVSTICLSLSDVFDSAHNAAINRTHPGDEVDIDNLCFEISAEGFVLRLVLLLTDAYEARTPAEVLTRAAALRANQVTFKVLQGSGNSFDTPEDRWIAEHGASAGWQGELRGYLHRIGADRMVAAVGMQPIIAAHGMSVFVDKDCMSSLGRYAILRPNGRLYTRWDDRGSLIF